MARLILHARYFAPNAKKRQEPFFVSACGLRIYTVGKVW